jgi:hypothetical protein
MTRQDDMPRHDDPTEIEPRPQPAPMHGSRPGATTAQLRRDIESGATGDRVAVLDPASTPLGTDDEAAGAPPSPALVEAVRKAERLAAPPPGDPGQRTEAGLGLRLWAALGVAVALGLGAALLD